MSFGHLRQCLIGRPVASGFASCLACIHFDIFVYVEQRDKHFMLKEILVPLKSLKAGTFEVELNCEPSPQAWIDIGEVSFAMVMKRRKRNVELFGIEGGLDN